MAAVRTLWTYGKYDDGQIIKIYKLIGAYHDISDVLRQKRERRRRRRRVVIKMRAITLWSPENYRVPFPFWQVSNLRGWPRLVITCQSFLSPSFFRRSLWKKKRQFLFRRSEGTVFIFVLLRQICPEAIKGYLTPKGSRRTFFATQMFPKNGPSLIQRVITGQYLENHAKWKMEWARTFIASS